MKYLKTIRAILTVMAIIADLTACDKKEEVTFIVSPLNVTLGDGSLPTISIVTNGSWYVSNITDTWLTVTPNNGTGNATLTLKALSENTTKDVRSAQVVINESSSQQVRVVSVLQLLPTPVFQTSMTSLEFSCISGSKTLDITSNQSWTATSNESWCTVSPRAGINDGTVTISVSKNEALSPRTATVILTPDASSGLTAVSVQVKQEGYVEPVPGENDNNTPIFSRKN